MARIWLESHGRVVKWSDVAKGTEFSGVFGGLGLGHFGWLTDLETAEGSLTFPVPVVLERQLQRVRRGAEVTIRYDGMVANGKTGRDFHAFSVAAEEADVEPERKRMAAPADADEVPF